MAQNSNYSRYQLAATLVLLGIIIALALFMMFDERDTVEITINPPLPTATHTAIPPTGSPTPSLTPAPITVYITGAVANPEQLIDLPQGSRAEDAINAAGGALDDADLSGVNLAQVLQDGDLVHVPSVNSVSNDTPTPNTPTRLELNTATQADLESLPGIGAATAQNILAYREANGDFATLEDLQNVSGIGEATVENLRAYLMVNGQIPEAEPTMIPTAEPQPDMTEESEQSTTDLININTATQTELETLPGIGASKAADIIAYREANGNFASIDDLVNVSGIGEATVENLRALITIGE